MDGFRVRRADGEMLGPATKADLLAWAEEGRFDSDATLIDPDGAEASVMLDDALGPRLLTLEGGGRRPPGRLEILIGGVMAVGGLVMIVISALFPSVISLGGSHVKGGPATNWGFFIGFFAVLLVVGLFLIARGLRERKRAEVFHRLDES